MPWQNIGNIRGPAGLGVPVGGSTGQVLTKRTGADNDTQWQTPSPGVTDLNGLNDVTLASPVNNELLAYDTATAQWKNTVALTVGNTPPSSPSVGDIWIDTT